MNDFFPLICIIHVPMEIFQLLFMNRISNNDLFDTIIYLKKNGFRILCNKAGGFPFLPTTDTIQ